MKLSNKKQANIIDGSTASHALGPHSSTHPTTTPTLSQHPLST